MTQPTLLLDLDGTLVDSVPDLLASCNRMMGRRGLAPFTAPALTAMVGDGAPALVQRVMSARGRTPTEQDLRDFLDDYMGHVAESTRPYPGVAATLTRMAAAGWRLAVCSNKPVAAARSVLAELDLLDRFAAVSGGDSVPSRKPDPAHLIATLSEAGGVPGRAIMVGDHHNDIAAAKAAGIPCIFAAWGYGTDTIGLEANAVARSFSDVPALAARLLS